MRPRHLKERTPGKSGCPTPLNGIRQSAAGEWSHERGKGEGEKWKR